MISTLSIDPANRPTFQWDPVASGGVLTLRLFGALGLRELTRVAEAVRDRGRSPRDLVCIEFPSDFTPKLRQRSIRAIALELLRQARIYTGNEQKFAAAGRIQVEWKEKPAVQIYQLILGQRAT